MKNLYRKIHVVSEKLKVYKEYVEDNSFNLEKVEQWKTYQVIKNAKRTNKDNLRRKEFPNSAKLLDSTKQQLIAVFVREGFKCVTKRRKYW